MDGDGDVSNCIEMIKEMVRLPKGKEYLIEKFKIDDFLKENDVYDEEYTINDKIKRWFDLILDVLTNGLPEFIINEYYDENNNNCYKIDVNSFDLCDISKIFWCCHVITDSYDDRYFIIGQVDYSFIFVEFLNDTSGSYFIIRIVVSDSIEKIVTYGINDYARQKILSGVGGTIPEEEYNGDDDLAFE